MSKEYPNIIVPKEVRGYCGIGVEAICSRRNLGTLWRSAQILKADFIFLINIRYDTMRTDTMKSWKHIPLFEFSDFDHFYDALPKASSLVGVELDKRSVPLMSYKHPQRAVYLLGAEDKGLSDKALSKCDEIIQIPGEFSLNVSVAGTIVLYDRLTKNGAL
ncbi:MAG: RNA methyltransferase [Salinivirgaceae bacterium]|jgi:tRNA G18 (ribose-2'-O)-methylase SpoU|nr:RNA methyltransferase [Bacteroidales bacterium]HPW66380.1 RNA methyltransferase [Salinivirgaceae bacterium]